MTIILSSVVSYGQKDAKDASMFPEAKDNMQKVVINLPSKKDESNYKIELFVGRNAEVDNCNRHMLIGEFKDKDLKGWGYTFYEFKSKGELAGTLMACPDSKMVNQFVTGQTTTINYNSKIPVVVYIPKGMEVKYKIWSTKKKLISIK